MSTAIKHRPYCMTELRGSCNCGMRHSANLPWLGQAVSLINAANRQGWRVKRLRLTPEQTQNLKDATGQDAMCLGYLVAKE